MKLSSRERFLIGVLFTIIIWAVALEVFIWPCRAGYRKSMELMESGNQEREEMEFYLSHYEELEQKLKEWERLRNTEDFFYRDIDDIFMDGPAGRTVKESVITMEIECPDPKDVMTFADEIYREQKSVLVSFMDVEAVYESGEDGQETYQGMKGIVEVRYYYEEIG